MEMVCPLNVGSVCIKHSKKLKNSVAAGSDSCKINAVKTCIVCVIILIRPAATLAHLMLIQQNTDLSLEKYEVYLFSLWIGGVLGWTSMLVYSISLQCLFIAWRKYSQITTCKSLTPRVQGIILSKSSL